MGSLSYSLYVPLCRFDIFYNKMVKSAPTNISLFMAFFIPFALLSEDEFPRAALPDLGL